MHTKQLLSTLEDVYSDFYNDIQERFQETMHIYPYFDYWELGETFLEDLIEHNAIDAVDFEEINLKLVAIHAIEYLRLAA